MDYGGHDSRFADNLVFVGDSDGQNCVNAGSMLDGHGTVYTGNKCILSHSKNIGHTAGCDCPGKPDPPKTPGGQPGTSCGLTMGNNSYFAIGDCTVSPSLCKENVTMRCSGSGVDWDAWAATGSDPGSHVYEMPSDDELFLWARQTLRMQVPPAPAPPAPRPLPPAPPPHFNNTCGGHCAAAGWCCRGRTSGCNQPSCAQGCLIAGLVPTSACEQACQAMKGRCSYTVQGTQLEECGSCGDGCSACEGVGACVAGCHFYGNHTPPTGTPVRKL